MFILSKVSCGTLSGIPSKIPQLTSEVFTLIEIAVPVLLIIMGMIDMFKSVTAPDEKDIAKGRKLFITRLITGLLVFFIIAVVKTVIRFVDSKSNSDRIISCVNCFINGPKDCNSNEVDNGGTNEN